MWWVKSRRAQSETDYETWVEGGLVPTLNQFDGGDVRATVLIFEATRVNDVRIYEDNSPTVATYWGTGGARVPYVFPIQGSQIGRTDKNGPQGNGHGEDDGVMFTLNTTDRHAIASPAKVRRLTPTECERLQGFPDGWTDGQSDSVRYRQIGNAVAVPVVEWIMERLVANDKMV